MTEQGTPQTTSFATINESGPFSLVETGLPLGISYQPDISTHTSADLGNISYRDLISQEKLVDTIKITTSSLPNKKLWEFENEFPSVVKLHAPRQNVFRLLSWNLHFRFEFRSNFQQVGMALIYQHNYPPSAMSYLLDQKFDITHKTEALPMKLATQLPHIKVAFGENLDVHAVMKWNVPHHALASDQRVDGNYAWKISNSQDYFSQNPMNVSMGSIVLSAPIQMQVAAGVTPEMTVRIWSWLTDVKFAAYQPSETTL